MPEVSRFSELSAARQALVRLLQSLNYGHLLRLHVRAGEPCFSPPPVILAELKLEGSEQVRQEVELTDFVLREEVRRLMEKLDLVQDGTIERIEVRAGIPRRVVYESPISKVPR
jgi:hypothetical protein